MLIFVGNCIGDKGMQAIAAVLKHNTSVKTLYVNSEFAERQ